MKRGSNKYRLTSNSFPEIEGPFKVVCAQLRQKNFFGGEHLQPGHVLSALVLRFVRLSQEDRDREAMRWLAEFELLAADTDAEKSNAQARIDSALKGSGSGLTLKASRDLSASENPVKAKPKASPKRKPKAAG